MESAGQAPKQHRLPSDPRCHGDVIMSAVATVGAFFIPPRVIGDLLAARVLHDEQWILGSLLLSCLLALNATQKRDTNSRSLVGEAVFRNAGRAQSKDFRSCPIYIYSLRMVHT
jgi:hypothetical protein